MAIQWPILPLSSPSSMLVASPSKFDRVQLRIEPADQTSWPKIEKNSGLYKFLERLSTSKEIDENSTEFEDENPMRRIQKTIKDCKRKKRQIQHVTLSNFRKSHSNADEQNTKYLVSNFEKSSYGSWTPEESFNDDWNNNNQNATSGANRQAIRKYLISPQQKNKKPVYVSISQQTVNGLLSLLLLFIVSTCGCIGAIFIISALTVMESLQTRGNCFLVSLALSHLLVSLFVLPSSALQIIAADGIDAISLCHYQWLTLEFSLFVGQASFLLIAVDNFLGFKSSEKLTTNLQLTLKSNNPITSSSSSSPSSSCSSSSSSPTTATATATTNGNNYNLNRNVPFTASNNQNDNDNEHPFFWSPNLMEPICTNSIPFNIDTSLTRPNKNCNNKPIKQSVFRRLSSLRPRFKSPLDDHKLTAWRIAQLFASRSEPTKLQRPGCLSYRNCCGRFRVLLWIMLVWLLTFFYEINQRHSSFGPKFCLENSPSSSSSSTPSPHSSSSPTPTSSEAIDDAAAGSNSIATTTITIPTTATTMKLLQQTNTFENSHLSLDKLEKFRKLRSILEETNKDEREKEERIAQVKMKWIEIGEQTEVPLIGIEMSRQLENGLVDNVVDWPNRSLFIETSNGIKENESKKRKKKKKEKHENDGSTFLLPSKLEPVARNLIQEEFDKVSEPDRLLEWPTTKEKGGKVFPIWLAACFRCLEWRQQSSPGKLNSSSFLGESGEPNKSLKVEPTSNNEKTIQELIEKLASLAELASFTGDYEEQEEEEEEMEDDDKIQTDDARMDNKANLLHDSKLNYSSPVDFEAGIQNKAHLKRLLQSCSSCHRNKPASLASLSLSIQASLPYSFHNNNNKFKWSRQAGEYHLSAVNKLPKVTRAGELAEVASLVDAIRGSGEPTTSQVDANANKLHLPVQSSLTGEPDCSKYARNKPKPPLMNSNNGAQVGKPSGPKRQPITGAESVLQSIKMGRFHRSRSVDTAKMAASRRQVARRALPTFPNRIGGPPSKPSEHLQAYVGRPQLMMNNSNDQRLYWVMLIVSLGLPSMLSSVLFARAYLRMKAFKMRSNCATSVANNAKHQGISIAPSDGAPTRTINNLGCSIHHCRPKSALAATVASAACSRSPPELQLSAISHLEPSKEQTVALVDTSSSSAMRPSSEPQLGGTLNRLTSQRRSLNLRSEGRANQFVQSDLASNSGQLATVDDGSLYRQSKPVNQVMSAPVSTATGSVQFGRPLQRASLAGPRLSPVPVSSSSPVSAAGSLGLGLSSRQASPIQLQGASYSAPVTALHYDQQFYANQPHTMLAGNQYEFRRYQNHAQSFHCRSVSPVARRAAAAAIPALCTLPAENTAELQTMAPPMMGRQYSLPRSSRLNRSSGLESKQHQHQHQTAQMSPSASATFGSGQAQSPSSYHNPSSPSALISSASSIQASSVIPLSADPLPTPPHPLSPVAIPVTIRTQAPTPTQVSIATATTTPDNEMSHLKQRYQQHYHHRQQHQHHHHHQSHGNRNKVILCTYIYMTDDQLLKSNIIAFIINLILWLPFVLLSIAVELGHQPSQQIKDSIWWLATLNCCLTSYIYAMTNRDFREAFNKLFYYCCCKSHVTFQTRRPIYRQQFDLDSAGNLRVHIVPGLNSYSTKLAQSNQDQSLLLPPI